MKFAYSLLLSVLLVLTSLSQSEAVLYQRHETNHFIIQYSESDAKLSRLIAEESEKFRAKIIEELLRSLNPARQDIDELWAREAEKRVQEIKAGKVETVSGEEVFKRIKDRLGS